MEQWKDKKSGVPRDPKTEALQLLLSQEMELESRIRTQKRSQEEGKVPIKTAYIHTHKLGLIIGCIEGTDIQPER